MLKDIVSPYLKANAFSGAILAARNGQILHREAFGKANISHNIPVTPETRFHIASVSKPFTAVAIMQLVERSDISIETPLTDFVPDIVNANQITIGHLLGHQSGLPNINLHPDYDKLSKIGVSLAELIEIFRTYDAEFEPGDRYQYSNTNYNLLAYIIEQVTGMSFGEALRHHIFDPLAMAHTLHDDNPTKIIPDLAEGYSPAGLDGLEKSPYLDWSIKTGNGSLISTVDDLYKFDRALDTDQLISQDTYRLMVENSFGLYRSELEGHQLVGQLA